MQEPSQDGYWITPEEHRALNRNAKTQLAIRRSFYRIGMWHGVGVGFCIGALVAAWTMVAGLAQ